MIEYNHRKGLKQMTIDITKTYKVTKFAKTDTDLGNLPGTDVRKMLKGYTYDEDFGIWYSPAANIGYSVEEV